MSCFSVPRAGPPFPPRELQGEELLEHFSMAVHESPFHCTTAHTAAPWPLVVPSGMLRAQPKAKTIISQDTQLPAQTGKHWTLGYACGLDVLPAMKKESQTSEPSSSQRNISAILHLYVVQNGAAACKVSHGSPAAWQGAATGCFGPRGRLL